MLRLTRPDCSQKTYWRHVSPDLPLDDPALEAALPQAASLTGLPAGLLEPGVLPDLAEDEAYTLKFEQPIRLDG